MKILTAKLLFLFLTFFVGVTAYYVYYLSPAPVEKTQHTPKVSDVASKQVLNTLEEQPEESNFYDISPCDEANSFKRDYPRAKGTVSGGVLNHRVICGDLPKYPQSTDDFSETVTVYILTDDLGEVVDARIKNGHQLVNKSVLSAARRTRFAPMVLGGQPVNVRGFLVYKFDKGKVWLKKLKDSV